MIKLRNIVNKITNNNSDIVCFILLDIVVIILSFFVSNYLLVIFYNADMYEQIYDGVMNFNSAICIGILVSFSMGYIETYRKAVLQMIFIVIVNFGLIIISVLFSSKQDWVSVALLLTLVSVYKLFRFLCYVSKKRISDKNTK